jgi:hypothetical protein
VGPRVSLGDARKLGVQLLDGLAACGCWRLWRLRRGWAIHKGNRCSLGRLLGVPEKVSGCKEAQ